MISIIQDSRELVAFGIPSCAFRLDFCWPTCTNTDVKNPDLKPDMLLIGATLNKKTTNELQFVSTGAPLDSVEIDLDSLPENAFGYDDIVYSALDLIAKSRPDLRATIYVYEGPSINFHDMTAGAFFGVADDSNVLKSLYQAFRSTPGVRVRYSEMILESQALRQYHIEDGKVWKPYEAYTWIAGPELDDTPEEDEISEEDDELDSESYETDDDLAVAAEENFSSVSGRVELPARFRAARADASVGTIIKRIESIFGLPEGSVALRGPDKKVLRVDATIRTLRRRWE